MKNWLIKILIAFDYFINAFAPASHPGMTISSHAGMAARDGRWWGKALCYVLDRIDKNHCANSMRGDMARAKAVIDELTPYVDALGSPSVKETA